MTRLGCWEFKARTGRSFLKKRTKKTLIRDAVPNLSAMASTLPQAQAQKSFGSFLQKRTFLPSTTFPSAAGLGLAASGAAGDEGLLRDSRQRLSAEFG
jgi:hypothetical protein